MNRLAFGPPVSMFAPSNIGGPPSRVPLIYTPRLQRVRTKAKWSSDEVLFTGEKSENVIFAGSVEQSI